MRENMLLADLNLEELPTPVLVSMKKAINELLLIRKKAAFIERTLKRHASVSIKEPLYPESYEEAKARIISHNSRSLFALPKSILHMHYRERLRYLPCVLAQNWESVFPYGDNSVRQFYVYAHVDPREASTALPSLTTILTGGPFYIGKGSKNRAWDLKRNQGHGKYIAHIRAAGFPDSSMVNIIENNLTEREALVFEAKLIYILGSIYDERVKGCLVNLADHVRPLFKESMTKFPSRKSFNAKVQAWQAEQLMLTLP
jgi:hypothetical protein